MQFQVKTATKYHKVTARQGGQVAANGCADGSDGMSRFPGPWSSQGLDPQRLRFEQLKCVYWNESLSTNHALSLSKYSAVVCLSSNLKASEQLENWNTPGWSSTATATDDTTTPTQNWNTSLDIFSFIWVLETWITWNSDLSFAIVGCPVSMYPAVGSSSAISCCKYLASVEGCNNSCWTTTHRWTTHN